MSRRVRFSALAAAVALALSACASNDAKESDVVNAVSDALADTEVNGEPLTDAQIDDTAACVGSGIDDAFGDDQDLYNDIAAANSADDYPDEARATIEGVLDDCMADLTGESAGGDGSTDTTDAEGEGDGEATTTTAAG
jgi:hypothetical protein